MSNYGRRVKRIERQLIPERQRMTYVIEHYEKQGIYIHKGNPYNDNAEGKPYTDYEKLKQELDVRDRDLVILLTRYGDYKPVGDKIQRPEVIINA